MFSYNILAGSADVSVVIRIVDSTDGTPETGVTSATAGLALEYRREGAVSTALTESDLAALTTAHTDGGMKHIGNGYYRVDLPDAAVAASSAGCLVHGTCTGMIVIGCYINLTEIPVDVRKWLGTACATPTVAGVPEVDVTHWIGTAAATPTTAGVPEVDITHIAGSAVSTSTAQLGVNVVNAGGAAVTAASGRMEVNTTHWAGTAVATPDTAGYPKVTVKSGAGTGEISLSSGGVSLSTSGLGAVADAVLDEAVTDHRAANSLGSVLQPLHSGACQAGGNSTTVVLATSASSADDYYNGDLIVGWVTADGTNKFADYITDYTGSTRTATVTGIPVSPGATYTYVVLPGGTIPGASAPSSDDNAAAVWNALLANYTSEGSFGNAIGGEVTHEGTLQSAASTSSVVLDATGSSSTNDTYNYQRFEVVAGTGAGQASYISDYVGSSKTATLNPALAVQCDNTSRYIIRKLGLDASTPANVATAVWSATRAGNALAGTFGEYVNADAVRVSGSATAADNLQLGYDGTGYAGGTTKQAVVLADGTHGGSAATLTLKRAVISNTTNDETALDISSSGTGNAHAVRVNASGGGKGLAIGAASVGLSVDSSGADAIQVQGGTNSDGLQISGNGSGVDIRADITGDITGNLSGSAGSVTGAVGSVTGAVGSVTGNVGGNVVGSVGSVTGAVGSVTGAVASVTGAVGSVTAPVTVGTNNDKTGYALSNTGIDALFTRQLTEAYAADGAAPTVTQALMLIQQMLGDFEISGTTLTVKKLNGSTTAATFTLNDGTTPTGITRAS